MTLHLDDKGKIFTNVVSKEAVLATIQTPQHCIHGMIYVRKDERLKDELTRADQFIAVTDAVVYDLHGNELHRAGFMVVNRDHIVWLIPDDEMLKDQNSGGAE